VTLEKANKTCAEAQIHDNLESSEIEVTPVLKQKKIKIKKLLIKAPVAKKLRYDSESDLDASDSSSPENLKLPSSPLFSSGKVGEFSTSVTQPQV